MSATSIPASAEPLGRLRRESAAPWQRWLAGAACVVVAGVGAFGLARSAIFGLDTIRVVGNQHLTRREVVRLAGLTLNTNLLSLDLGRVERRLEEEPWISDAAVSRSLPSEVTIRIRERRAVAVVSQGGRFLLVAGDGRPLGTVLENPGLPVLSAAADVPTRAVPVPATGGPSAALAPMPPGIRARVRDVTVRTDGSLELRLASGTRVLFGRSSTARHKVLVLTSILRWARAQGVRLAEVDVRVPTAPTARSA